MVCRLLIVIAILLVSPLARAALVPFPPGLRELEVASGDATLHVRVGGQGPAVVMLHGFGDTGDMWAPLASDLVRDHTAADIAAILSLLKVDRAGSVTYDIGNMVGYAFAALSGEPHFAETRAEPVTVYISGYGPTDTINVEAVAPPPPK